MVIEARYQIYDLSGAQRRVLQLKTALNWKRICALLKQLMHVSHQMSRIFQPSVACVQHKLSTMKPFELRMNIGLR